MDARVERESTKREMYILGLVQHGENISWNIDKPVTSRRVSCVGPVPKGTESAGINRWKEEIERGFSSSLVTHVGRPKTVIVVFKRTGSWRRMLGRKERKCLASLSESAESASQTTASVDSRTCLRKDLKARCEKLMDETNLLHNPLGVSPVVEITLVEYLIMGGVFSIEGILCWRGRSECEILLVDG